MLFFVRYVNILWMSRLVSRMEEGLSRIVNSGTHQAVVSRAGRAVQGSSGHKLSEQELILLFGPVTSTFRSMQVCRCFLVQAQRGVIVQRFVGWFVRHTLGLFTHSREVLLASGGSSRNRAVSRCYSRAPEVPSWIRCWMPHVCTAVGVLAFLQTASQTIFVSDVSSWRQGDGGEVLTIFDVSSIPCVVWSCNVCLANDLATLMHIEFGRVQAPSFRCGTLRMTVSGRSWRRLGSWLRCVCRWQDRQVVVLVHCVGT